MPFRLTLACSAQALRATSRQQGLDGDRGFFEVERIAAEEVVTTSVATAGKSPR